MRKAILLPAVAAAATGILGGNSLAARSAADPANGGRPLLADALSMRAEVAALLSKPMGPTTEDFLRATTLASAAVRLAPTEPWGYAAHCDIATRWGDARMIETCLQDLRRVAPAHAETKRAEAAHSALSAGRARHFGIALAWAALALSCLATMAHALVRLLRARARQSSRIAATLLVAAMMLAETEAAHAAGPAPTPAVRFTIDDTNPEAGVPNLAAQNQAPLDFGYYLQDMIERAANATTRGDHAAAVRYYRALAKAVPDRSTAWSKLCASYEAAGDPVKALLACREALGRAGVVGNDYARFVHLILAKKGELAPVDVEDVREVVKHLDRDPETRLAAHHLECELGLRVSDAKLLESCTKALGAVAPDDARTISFAWALAIQKGDRETAARLVERARAAGIAPDGIARMERATAERAPLWRGRLLGWRVLLVAGVLCLAGAAAFIVARRRRESRQAPA